jgi:regulator of ribosome biosynthesis
METETNLTYDLGILTLFDSNPLKFKCDLTNPKLPKLLEEQSIQNIKRLAHSLYALKVQKDQKLEAIPDEHQVIDFGESKFDVKLPQVKTAFPRHKKIPEQKALTKWERFAKEKGIQKVKRSRMVFDEITKSYVPRWGPGSIKKIQASTDIIRPVKPGENPNEDPFEKKSKTQQLQREKQKYSELRNKMEAKGLLRKDDVPQTMKQMNHKNRDKKATKKALEIAQNSTASMGMFDKKSHKEEPEIRKKRKNVATHFGSAKEENRRDLDILEQVVRNQGSQKVSK